MSKKVLLSGIVLILILNMTVYAWAATPPIAVSDSYKSGQYYTKLCNALDQYASASQKDRFVEVALSQKGYKANSTSGNLSGNGNALGMYCEYSRVMSEALNVNSYFGDEWCAAFVSWCGRMAGLPISIIPNTVGAGTYRSVGTQHKLWSSDYSTYQDYQPKKGDIVLLTPTGSYWNSTYWWSKSSHVAIVAEDSTTRASDGGWLFTTIERGGDYSGNISEKEADNTVGSRTASTKKMRPEGYPWFQMIVTPNWQDSNKPVVTDVSIVDKTSSGFGIICKATDDVAVAKIQIAVWNDTIGIDNAKWFTVDSVNSGATFQINASDYGNAINTTYHVNVLAIDSAGNISEVKSAPNTLIENIKPQVTEISIKDISKTSFGVVCKASDNSKVSKFQIAVWNDVIGINNAKWETVDVSKPEYSFYVDIADYGNEQNTTYHVNVIAIDDSWNYSETKSAPDVFIETEPPVVTELTHKNITTTGYDLVCKATDNSDVARFQIGTWNDVIGVSNAKWETVGAVNGQATLHIDVADYGNAVNTTYYSNVFAFDKCGNTSSPKGAPQIPIETEKPRITNTKTENITETGYDVVCDATDNTKVEMIQFAIWNDVIGINNAVWKNVTTTDNKATLHVSISDFDNQTDTTYHVRVFAFDQCGNNSEGVLTEDVFITDASHVHVSESIPGKAATCTEDGMTDGIKCSECGAVLKEQEVIKATGHNMTEHKAVEATCTTDGNTAYWSCDQCKGFFSDADGKNLIDENSWIISASGHNMTEHKAVEATCTTDGNIAYWSCDQCKGFFSDADGKNLIDENNWVIPANHHLTEHKAVSATCQATGNSAYWSCDQCKGFFSDADGKNLIDENSWVIPANHHLTEHKAVSATCQATGNSAYWSCDQCNGYFGDAEGKNSIAINSWIIGIADHTWNANYTTDKPATCKEEGSESIHCTVCGVIKEGTARSIAKDDHTWDKGTETKPATTSSEGIRTYTCTVCNATKTETIPKLKEEAAPASTPATKPSAPAATPSSTPEPKAVDGTAVGKGASSKKAASAIKTVSSDEGPSGSTFARLQARVMKTSRTSITIKWTKPSGAAECIIFGAKCGKKYKEIGRTASNSFTQKKLKKGTYYKYIVMAVSSKQTVIATSKTIHIITDGSNKGNYKSVSVNKKGVTLAKKGKTFQIRAKAVAKTGKIAKAHRKLAYESSNPKIAKVNKYGKITAVKKGKCTVFVYAADGTFVKIKVTVRK